METDISNEEVTPPRKSSINLLKRVPHIYNSSSMTPLAQSIRDECIFYKCTPVSIDSPFRMLGNHSTPPSQLLKVKNPFDVVLADKLHLPIHSPSIFAKPVISNSTEKFEWTIDEISSINPAPIEEFPSHQFEEPEDPELESTAHANIEKYFSKNLIVPSPWHQPAKPLKLPVDLTPSQSVPNNGPSMSKDVKSKRNCYSQTILSLPSDLPENVLKVLQPYFTFTQDQQLLNDSNIDNTSLCRKLFHHSPVSTDSDVEYSALSPIPVSPCIETFNKFDMGRNYGSPLNEITLSPQVSPILKQSEARSEDKHCNFHWSTPSPNKKHLVRFSADTLEESPLSPISKNLFGTSKDISTDKLPSPLDDREDNMNFNCSAMPVAFERTENDPKNKKETDAKFDFTVEMSIDSSMNVVPDINLTLPEQSTSSINSLSVSNMAGDFAESFIDWDIENKIIVNEGKLFDLSKANFNDNVNPTELNTVNKAESAINTILNTPTKTRFGNAAVKRLSRVLSENFPSSADKENVHPRNRSLIRRSFSNMEINSHIEKYVHGHISENLIRHVNKRHCSVLVENDDGIRDRSVLHKDGNSSFADQIYENMFSSSQDTGYVSNECGETAEI